jgi:hypothetical protein
LHNPLGTFGWVPQIRIVDQLVKVALGHRIVELQPGVLSKLTKVPSGDERNAMSTLFEEVAKSDEGMNVTGATDCT